MSFNFNNPKLVEALQKSIEKKARGLAQINLMEVCGTHTMSIAHYGIKNLLPKNINLLSGPGCPVCVTPNSSIDKMIALCNIPNFVITTFGDMMRVPGSSSNLITKQADGAHIKIVYSPLDALQIAQENSKKNVVFLAVGFETTAPTTAAVIKRAQNLNLKNFFVFCAHKNMPGALELIANDPKVKINGLILPGHVSTITGLKSYKFLADKYKIPGVVSGFEAVDIMQSIEMLVSQIANNECKIQNAYTRGVNTEGNINAQNLIDEVFDTCNSTWRGLGNIPQSGYKIKEKYKNFDVEQVFDIRPEQTKENSACKCGDVLRGIITPKDCPLFSKICNPENPVGPCMVSTEGSCAASYKYQ